MSRPIFDLVFPRLAQRLNRQLRRFRAGRLTEVQFSHQFDKLLQQQHAWLANRGVDEVQAAEAIHSAVLVLSAPGLEAEALEQGLPLEVIEYQAVRAAASDIAETYGVSERRTADRLSQMVARYTSDGA